MMAKQNKSFGYCLKEIKKEAIKAATKRGLSIKIADALLQKKKLPEDSWDINAKNDIGEAFITFLFKATTPKVEAWISKFAGQTEPELEPAKGKEEDLVGVELSDDEINKRIALGLPLYEAEVQEKENVNFSSIDVEKVLNKHGISLLDKPSELNEVRKKIRNILIKRLTS